MSKIRNEIERYLYESTGTDTILTSSFMFPAEFTGFQGHFPTNKILPGACQIQCALTTIENALKQRVVLKEILLSKFIAPVFPGDKVTCDVSQVPDTGVEFIYKARISKDTEKVTDLKLRVSLGEAL